MITTDSLIARTQILPYFISKRLPFFHRYNLYCKPPVAVSVSVFNLCVVLTRCPHRLLAAGLSSEGPTRVYANVNAKKRYELSGAFSENSLYMLRQVVVRALTRVKIENRSRKRSHKLYVLGVGRVRTCPLYPDSAFDSVTYD